MTVALRGYDAWLSQGNPHESSAGVCMCNHDHEDHAPPTVKDSYGEDLELLACSVKGCPCAEFEEATDEAVRWSDPRIP